MNIQRHFVPASSTVPNMFASGLWTGDWPGVWPGIWAGEWTGDWTGEEAAGEMTSSFALRAVSAASAS